MDAEGVTYVYVLDLIKEFIAQPLPAVVPEILPAVAELDDAGTEDEFSDLDTKRSRNEDDELEGQKIS